jgi:stage III sporulation protein AH
MKMKFKKNKQTVWLVSMLSLMVVLSAYYLFTDDMNTKKIAKTAAWNRVVDDQVSVETTGDDYFANVQMERDEQQEAEFNRLMDTLDKSSDATATETMKTLENLQNTSEKVTALEEQFADEYKNAVITEKDGNWHVSIQKSNLKKTDAVSIIERVMAELKVQPSHITIHTIAQ